MSENTMKVESNHVENIRTTQVSKVMDDKGKLPLNQKVADRCKKIVRERGNDYLVYIDKSDNLRFEFGLDIKDNKLHDVLVELEMAAAIPIKYIGKAHYQAWTVMLGQAVSLLNKRNAEHAMDVILRAKQFVQDRALEKARFWMVESSILTSGVSFLICLLLAVHFREKNNLLLPFMAMGCGVIGAQFSVLARLNTIQVDAAAGRVVHWGDAAIRIISGVFAALIVYVAIKSEVVFGFISFAEVNDVSKKIYEVTDFWILAFMSTLAGFSERFVPSFLAKMEVQTLADIGKPEGDKVT